jgi:hypothetical protein
MIRSDPGPCPICGAAHCACGGGPILVEQLPQRDAAARPSPDPSLETSAAPAGETDAGAAPSLGDGTDGQPFSTASYRGGKPHPPVPPPPANTRRGKR